MKKLRYAVIGLEGPRTTHFSETIGQTLRAAMVGRVGWPVKVEIGQEADLIFYLGGIYPTPEFKVVQIDLSDHRCEPALDLDYVTQPGLANLAVSGFPIPADISKKLANLDASELRWATIGDPTPSENNFTEDQIWENPALLDPVSHVLVFSHTNRPSLIERLALHRGCLVFNDGVDKKYADRAVIPAANGVDDFLNQCEAISKAPGGSSKAFRGLVAGKIFSEDAVSARDARSIIGSILRKVHGDDFGLLSLQVAQERLVKMAKRNLSK